ncbi:MAG: hypothetical protein ABMA64_04065 [Myxococcota bacterium]
MITMVRNPHPARLLQFVPDDGDAVCRSLPVDRDWVEGARFASASRTKQWRALVDETNAPIDARRARYLHDGRLVAQRVGDLDRRIANVRARLRGGRGDLHRADHEQAQKARLEQEAAVLWQEDCYAHAVEKNLEQLERLRRIAPTSPGCRSGCSASS